MMVLLAVLGLATMFMNTATTKCWMVFRRRIRQQKNAVSGKS